MWRLGWPRCTGSSSFPCPSGCPTQARRPWPRSRTLWPRSSRSIWSSTRKRRTVARPARAALVEALLAGHTPHPDQARVRRALERLGSYWRRSGGRLTQAATEHVTARLAAQLARVGSWDEFINARLELDVDQMVPEAERGALDALPASVHLYGDRVPVDYEVEQGIGVVRLRLKEGQARRLPQRGLDPH